MNRTDRGLYLTLARPATPLFPPRVDPWTFATEHRVDIRANHGIRRAPQMNEAERYGSDDEENVVFVIGDI